MKSIKWFKKRIGKTVFRDRNNCNCDECKDTLKNGLIICDDNHAEWLFTIQCDLKEEGIDLNYRDKK